ncbi:MAG: hypothetical protein QW469_01190 [Candidatus Aenigmatarchaeota archaeon]
MRKNTDILIIIAVVIFLLFFVKKPFVTIGIPEDASVFPIPADYKLEKTIDTGNIERIGFLRDWRSADYLDNGYDRGYILPSEKIYTGKNIKSFSFCIDNTGSVTYHSGFIDNDFIITTDLKPKYVYYYIKDLNSSIQTGIPSKCIYKYGGVCYDNKLTYIGNVSANEYKCFNVTVNATAIEYNRFKGIEKDHNLELYIAIDGIDYKHTTGSDFFYKEYYYTSYRIKDIKVTTLEKITEPSNITIKPTNENIIQKISDFINSIINFLLGK